MVVRLPTVATKKVADISLPPVASPLWAVSLPTVATEIPAVSLPTVAADPNLRSVTIDTTSGSAGTSSYEELRSLAISDRLVNSCLTETCIDHHIDDDNDRESENLHHTIDGLAEYNSSSVDDFSESSRSRKKSKKRTLSTSDNRRGNSKKPTSPRSNVQQPKFSLNKWQQ